MDKERADFAQRLREALRDAGIEPSAAVVEKEFNQRYRGRTPISPQAVSLWLNGRSMPRQDKIRVLAEIAGVDPSVLQYGGKPRVAEARSEWERLAPQDRAMLDAFVHLPLAQRKLVRDLIAALAAGQRRD